MRSKRCCGSLGRTALTLILLAMSLTSCVDDGVETTTSTTQESRHCASYAGYPVVWHRGFELEGETFRSRSRQDETSWPVDESAFELASAYWALEPSYLYSFIGPDSRGCVGRDDRWVVIAQPPISPEGRWRVPFSDPSGFDEAEWDQIIAHPWRLDRFGPPGAANQEPSHQGVVKFTDQLAVTSSTCDTRPNVVLFRGDALAPMEFPQGEATMVCTPPPGVEPAEGEQMYLPIGGTPTIEDGELVVEHQGVKYRYVPITEAEYVAGFQRNSFFHIDDPLAVLKDWEAESFDEFDNPSTSNTTGTTKPDS